MYLRKVQVRSSNGQTHQYLRLQETFRQRLPGGGTRHRQRVLCNLGRVDLIAPHAARLYQLLTGDKPAGTSAVGEDSVQAWGWGPLLVLRHLWEQLDLDRILGRLGRCAQDPQGRDLAERAFALVANRLMDPVSEHGLAQWLEGEFVCDQRGKRWLGQWREDGERRASRSPRVRVEWRWLQGWYRALDRLLACKSQLEVELFRRLRTLFEVKVELALYDITSTYFEGAGPGGLAKHGHSRDQRPRQRQVVMGLVLIDGWPIAHHVFAGNRQDATTVKEVVADLRERFGLKRIVLVGDRGMLSEKSRQVLGKAGCGYLLGLPRRNRSEAEALLAEAQETPLESWTQVDPGWGEGVTRVVEVQSTREGGALPGGALTGAVGLRTGATGAGGEASGGEAGGIAPAGGGGEAEEGGGDWGGGREDPAAAPREAALQGRGRSGDLPVSSQPACRRRGERRGPLPAGDE